MKHFNKYSWAVLLLLVIPLLFSCKDEEEADVIAGFTYSQDASDFLKFTFTNTSQNYATVSWDFGDGTAASTEVNPVHTFPSAAEYTVTMTAKSSGGKTDSYTQKVAVTDPNVLLTKLAGSDMQTWKLIRDVSTGRYPIECGPWDHTTVWWAQGKGNDELANRPCMLNDEWIFHRDGTMEYNANGDYWAEGGWFTPENICASTADPMVNGDGTDLSAWGSGTHTFRIINGTTPKITAIGKGAFIGFFKLGNLVETKTPQDSVQYNIVSLTEGAVDTLIIEGQYKWDAGDGGYWRHVLVHYDDPSQEPALPGNKPNVSFSVEVNGMTVTINNATTGATTNSWDFGDGNTSTAASPTHTYAGGGPYLIQYSASNINGESTGKKNVFISTADLTDAALQGAPWKVKAADMTVFVGPAMGSGDWWNVPVGFFNGSAAGTPDDWSCLPDDEFTFSAGGVFTYDTKGSARNDGYFGGTNGCIDDAGIAASGNGVAFGSATHSYTFTPASGANRAVILLTNGAGKAAFIGFYKGYYGGENSDATKAPNGGNPTNKYEVMGYATNGAKEYLFVTVDISVAHDASASWSAILER
ncbi:MAG: PKD domain-containing protein [Bacteroidales bacterium]|nr:PKD domain-containing protein [Bacteroidales bacterium]